MHGVAVEARIKLTSLPYTIGKHPFLKIMTNSLKWFPAPFLLIAPISILGLSEIPQVQYPNFARASPISLGKVPLDSSDPLALPGRDYDHATVAINSDLDVVVAFHSSRKDVAASMKQVEIAYYQWQVGDTWLHKGTKTLGNMNFDPLFGTAKVKCERPDVVAVNDNFLLYGREGMKI